VEVQEVRRDIGGTKPTRKYTFFYTKLKVNHTLLKCLLKCRWCHVIALNVHAPADDKIDDVKDSFYEELERVFDKFP
jgi:hypothetical protein